MRKVLLNTLLMRKFCNYLNIDSEDTLQIACAKINGLDVIVTRDNSGFQAATIPVLSPDEFLATLK